MTTYSGGLRRIAGRAGHTGILVFFVTFLAFPFYWMLITTFKTTQDLHDTNNNPYLFSDPPTLDHLRVLFTDTLFLQWISNTMLVGLAVVIASSSGTESNSDGTRDRATVLGPRSGQGRDRHGRARSTGRGRRARARALFRHQPGDGIPRLQG